MSGNNFKIANTLQQQPVYSSTGPVDVAAGAYLVPLTNYDANFFTRIKGASNYMEFYAEGDLILRFRTIKTQLTPAESLPPVALRENVFKTITFLEQITEVYISNPSGSAVSMDAVAV